MQLSQYNIPLWNMSSCAPGPTEPALHYFMLTVDVEEGDDGERKNRYNFAPPMDRVVQTWVVTTRPDFPAAFLTQVRDAVVAGGLPSTEDGEARVFDVQEYFEGRWSLSVAYNEDLLQNVTVTVSATEHPLREVLGADLDNDARRAAVVAVIQQIVESFFLYDLGLSSNTEEPFYRRLLTL